MYDAIAEYKVTHLCGAPIVMSTLLNAPAEEKKPLPHVVQFATAAAPPPEAVLARLKAAGFNVTHVYGLTEVLRPRRRQRLESGMWTSCRSTSRRRRNRARACAITCSKRSTCSTRHHAAGAAGRRDARRGDVPRQRGDEGYLKNKRSTEAAFAGAGFIPRSRRDAPPTATSSSRTAQRHHHLRGENISSIEVEDALYKHAAVQAAAVVAKPDDKWGETPCAFVELKPGQTATGDELVAWCRKNLAGYKVPRHIVFAELPKTSTGKIQKFKLREMAKGL